MRVSVLGACLLALPFLLLDTPRARSEQIVLDGFVTSFPTDALGGIRSVIRYRQARPDRTDTAITFLGSPGSDGLPEEIQILGPTGDQVHPVDSQGADCVLERVAIVHQQGTVALIDAVRVFDAATLQAGYSAAARFAFQVYRLVGGDDPTESRLVFKASGPAQRTAALCSAADIQAAIAVSAQAVR